MAVYTQLSTEELADLIAHYDVGEVISAKGIAEGVSNSNWLIETSGAQSSSDNARYILTMYESRTDLRDLPFFLGLLDLLADKNCPVPRTIHDRAGASHRMIGKKAVALIEFLPGISIDHPSPAQARAVGRALAEVHLAAQNYDTRPNDMGLQAWRNLTDQCGAQALAQIDPSLPAAVRDALRDLGENWPEDLPKGVIHADLFPDNVLMLGDDVSGLIDFYFACTDFFAYDLAVTHAAWCFEEGGEQFLPQISDALIAGYEEIRKLEADELAALPTLARGAAMRFISTRAYDWINTPADALVTRKDPMDFVRRLQFYADNGAQVFAAS